MPLFISDIDEKIKKIEAECQKLLTENLNNFSVPLYPARNIPVVTAKMMPPRIGLDSPAGQARLLHDLANIELQAMELGLRTLYEFPLAPKLFREELVAVVLDESRHLSLCLDGIRSLGFNWGSWPAHMTLWDATSNNDSFLDRILIVHCYLEASGLDSGDIILNRLSGVTNKMPREIVSVIAHEEIGHVTFGLNWYRKMCVEENLNSQDDFGLRLRKLSRQLPTRHSKLSLTNRKLAGFTDLEISKIQNYSPEPVRLGV